MNSLSVLTPRFTSDLFEAMDRNLADYFTSLPSETKLIVPKVDVRETKSTYIMEMELPGLTENDVEISLKDHVLLVSSKKDERKEEKKDGEWLIRERRSMSFARRFTLPNDIDTDKVEASFKHGVLTIDVPRKLETQAKTISITAKS